MNRFLETEKERKNEVLFFDILIINRLWVLVDLLVKIPFKVSTIFLVKISIFTKVNLYITVEKWTVF